MNLKFLYPLLGLALGILISSEIYQGLALSLIVIGLAIFIWGVLTFLSKYHFRAYRISILHNIWIILLFLGIGSLDHTLRCCPETPFDLECRKSKFFGVVDEIKYLTDGDRLKIKIVSIQDSNHIYGCSNLNFLVKTDGYLASTGDKISFEVQPKKIGLHKERSDFEKQMIRQGINYYANVKASNITKEVEVFSLFKIFNDFRNKLIILLEKSSLKRETSEFIVSILLGDKTFLSSDVRQTLNSAGMAHVLALSGMHVAIILSIILWILFPLSLFGFHKSRKIIALGCIWIYVLVTGMSPSTVRAAIMATFVVGAYLLERKNSALNSLLAAILIILIWNPLSLWDVGLQLSFNCVASIIIFTNRLNPIEHHAHPITYKVVNIFLISIITIICTWTLVSYYFGTVPVLFLLSNMILVPFLPIFVAAGILYVFFLSFAIDIDILARLLDLFNNIFIEGTRFLSFSGNSTVSIKVPFLTNIFWIAGILCIAYILNTQTKRYKKSATVFSLLSIICAFIFIYIPTSEKTTKLTFIHSFTKLEAHHKYDNRTTKLEFPRKSISDIEHKDLKILAIDSRIHQDSLRSLIKKEIAGSHFLIVGAGAESNQIAELINVSNYTKIILHSSIGKNKKAELISLINESEIDKVYSLRENGSLEFDL